MMAPIALRVLYLIAVWDCADGTTKDNDCSCYGSVAVKMWWMYALKADSDYRQD